MNYINEVYKNICIKEDKSLLGDYLYYLYIYESLSNKKLSAFLNLPVPIVSAIKKEYIKLGIVEQKRGINLSDKGLEYVENILKLKGLDKPLLAILIEKDYDFHKVFENELEILKEIFEKKPKAWLEIDQTECTPETSLKRAVLALENNAILGKNILCLGDDDLVSVSITVLLNKIFKIPVANICSVTVTDIDDRILEFVNNFDGKIQIVKHDLTTKMSDDEIGKYDTVFTDPPYTLEGLALFMRCARLNLKNNFGRIFLSYGKKDNFTSFEIQKLFFSLNFLVKNILNNFNSYFGAGVIGGRSNMIILEALPYDNVDYLNKGTNKNIYTGNVDKKTKYYKCTKCKEIFVLGENMFIEELKEKGCSCGNNSFKLLKRTKA